MRRIPTFVLYADEIDAMQADWLHVETIQARSRLHDYRIKPHRHEHLFQILYMREGEAQLYAGEDVLVLAAPAVVTMPPVEVHGYDFSADVEGVVVTILEREVGAMLESAPALRDLFRAPRPVALVDWPEQTERLAASLDALMAASTQPGPARNLLLKAHLSLALAAISETVTPRPDETRAAGRSDLLVRRFRGLVEDHFRDHWPIGAYATRLGITQTHLNRLCREVLGLSALQVVNRRLVIEARRLLAFTSLEVKEIAGEIGFDDAAYFTRFFRRETGRTPLTSRAEMVGAAVEGGMAETRAGRG
ncbi:helix-turn-helix domain-containing protein [Hartmannibacter diazotrophicus]|uniref:helix-turn-helix domain-containing protein n=1 Tax=Hartmannibacter diazotrophicus TaxID=1482074 RepID=UPI00138FC73A|nr:helix-turn-helix domain-containing protein [Hartmannibacter diazotrophicus]